MNRQIRSWIPTLLFWTLFAASIGLGRRYAWLDTLWYAAGMLFLLGLSVCSVVYKIRHRHEAGGLSYQGIPRSLQRFFTDEDSERK